MTRGSTPLPGRIGARDWLLLCAGAFIAFGGRTIFDLGFAHDDWLLLKHMAGSTSFLGTASALIAGASSILFRPAEIPYFVLLHRAFGTSPLGWQIVSLCMNVALAGAFMSLLRRLGTGRTASLWAALLLLAWPAKDSTAFWPIAGVCAASALLTLTALNLHCDYVRLGGRARAAASTACLLTALAFYEQSVLLFPLWLLVPAEGEEKARRSEGCAWAAAAAVACVVYQRALAPWLFSLPHNKRMSLGAGHAAWVCLAALNANLGPKLLIFSAKEAARAALSRPELAISAAAIFAAARRGEEGDPPPRRLIAWGAAFAALAYLPLAFSDYSPTPLNHQNRLNLLPAAGVVAALAGLSGLHRRGGAALAAAAVAALLAHAGFAGVWAESYRRQLAIKEAVLSSLPLLKDASGLLVRLPERYVAGKAPVFDAHWDVTAAVSLWAGFDVAADVVRPETAFEADKVARPEGRTMPLRGLYVLDMTSGTLGPAPERPGDLAERETPR